MSTRKTHKALLAPALAADYVVKDVETYVPGSGELLVKAHSVALNPVDWKVHKLWPMDHYPAIYGNDMAGEVVEIGEGVEGFSKGDRM